MSFSDRRWKELCIFRFAVDVVALIERADRGEFVDRELLTELKDCYENNVDSEFLRELKEQILR